MGNAEERQDAAGGDTADGHGGGPSCTVTAKVRVDERYSDDIPVLARTVDRKTESIRLNPESGGMLELLVFELVRSNDGT